MPEGPDRKETPPVNLASCLAHPEFQGLLGRARTEPATDFPRIVCADWLESHGMAEPARRWRASLGAPFSRNPLPASFAQSTDSKFPVTWRVVDGFLHAEAFEGAPWAHAGMWRPWPRVTREWVGRVQRLASERGIAGLDLSRQVERGSLPELVSGLAPLATTHLWLDENGLVDSQVEALARTRTLVGIRTLRLGRNRLTARSASHLLGAPWARELVSLELEGNDRLGAQGFQLIGRAYVFGRLRRLHLAGCGAGDEGVFGLAEAKSQWPLEELDLRSNGFSAAGARALAGSTLANGLVRLELSGNNLTSAATRELLASLANGPLARLGMANCWIGAPVIEALAAGEGPGAIEDLDLGHNGKREGRKWGLGGDQLRVLARAGPMARLKALSLANMPWDGEMARLLAQEPTFRLQKIDLSGCRINPGSLPALLESPWLADVRSLVLDDNPLGDRGMAILAGHKAMARVRELSLARCSIGDEGLRLLGRSEALADIRQVDLRGQEFDRDLLAGSVDRLGLAGADYLARSGVEPGELPG